MLINVENEFEAKYALKKISYCLYLYIYKLNLVDTKSR